MGAGVGEALGKGCTGVEPGSVPWLRMRVFRAFPLVTAEEAVGLRRDGGLKEELLCSFCAGWFAGLLGLVMAAVAFSPSPGD